MKKTRFANISREELGIILIFISTCLLAFKGIFARLAYFEGASVDAVLLIRFGVSLPLMCLSIVFYKNHNIQKYFNRRDLSIIFVLALLGYYFATKADYYSIKFMGAGLSRMILYTFPSFVLIFTAIMQRKLPSLRHIIITLIIQFGLFAITSGGQTGLLLLNLKGALWALLAAFCYALHLSILGQYAKHISSHTITVGLISFATIFISIDFALTNNLSELFLPLKAYLWIILMAIFSTALPFFMVNEGIKYIGSNDTALISSFGPIFGLGLAYFIVDERYNFIQLIGCAIVITCIYLLCKKIGKKHVSPLD